MKYRKKPVVIEAIEYSRDGNIAEIQDWFIQNKGQESLLYDPKSNEYLIKTLEGNMKLTRGDYIIKGINNEFYPCKPDIFKKTYEEV